jgi:hypothetical protein
MVRGQSAQSSFWSGQCLGQTLVKVGQTFPNSRKCALGLHLEIPLRWWAPIGSDRLGQTLVKLGQPWSNLVKRFGPRLKVILMRRALVGSGWLGSGYLVLRADTRENPRGKNGVMTVVLLHPSLRGIYGT